MKKLGEKRYWDEFLRARWEFKECGGVPGLKFEYGIGMDAAQRTSNRICEGGLRADESYLF